jgi:membrane associated rhomboid family serine protease
MEFIVLPIGIPSLIGICIIIGTLLVSIYKKWLISYGIIFANLIVFFLTFVFPYEIILGYGENMIYGGLSFKPIYLEPMLWPQLYTLFSSMFIHSVGNVFHILGNMLIFFFVGVAFEQRVGWKRFLIIYLLSGMCGSLAHSMLNLGSDIPLIGASGAIFGIMGAFALSYPNDEVLMPIPLGFFMMIRRIRVVYAVLIFAVVETVMIVIGVQGVQDNTAHAAHIGGLLGGVLLAALLVRNRRISNQDTSSNQTIYLDSNVAPRPRPMDISSLRKYATTANLMEMLNRIERETVPQVKEIWLEHFLEKAVCPKCGKNLEHFDGKIWCEFCGYKDKY